MSLGLRNDFSVHVIYMSYTTSELELALEVQND